MRMSIQELQKRPVGGLPPENPNCRIICFDLDGTLADNYRRRPHLDLAKPPNNKNAWLAYMRDMENDELIEPIAQELRKYHQDGNLIVIVTARTMAEKWKTTNWLWENQIPHDHFIRYRGSPHTDRVEFKKYTLIHLRNVFNRTPDVLFDDDYEVVKMAREIGVNIVIDAERYLRHRDWLPNMRRKQRG